MVDSAEVERFSSDGVDVVLRGDVGLVVGESDAVERFHERLSAAGDEGSDAHRRPIGPAGLSAVSSGLGIAASHGEYLTLSPATRKLLGVAGNHLTAAKDGNIGGQIVGQSHRFVGNATLRAVNMGPDTAAAMQMALTTAALQLAIRDVQKAIERVEDKVDRIDRRVAAVQVGGVLGRNRYLAAQVEQWQRTGVLSLTDWSTVAPLGAELSADLEALRAYVERTVAAAAAGGSAPDRADAVRDLLDLDDELELLTLAEQSLFLWHALRLEHLRVHEPDQASDAEAPARAFITRQLEADLALVRGVRATGEDLTRVEALEIHRVLSRQTLAAGVDDLNALLTRFAASRGLAEADLIPAAHQPTLAEASAEAKRKVDSATDTAAEGAKRLANQLRERLDRATGADDARALGDGEQDRPRPPF